MGGPGNYATKQLAPALLETQSCYPAGLVTGSPDKARSWTSTYNIPTKKSYNYQPFDQIRSNLDIDIVYVILPDFLHAEYTIRAGKHVICGGLFCKPPKRAGRLNSIGAVEERRYGEVS